MNPFLSLTSHRRSVKLFVAFALIFMGICLVQPAAATMSQYKLTVASGSVTDMSSANVVYQGYQFARGDYGYSPSGAGYFGFNFNFNFDGTNYNSCVIYTNGLISLGAVTSNWSSRNIAGVNAPTIAPFWAYEMMSGNGCGGDDGSPIISYQTIGSAPNRVFIVQWKDLELSNWWTSPTYGWGYRGTFETRLYESPVPGEAGIVEMYYQYMGNKSCDTYYGGGVSAHIGMATSSSNYLFISYSGSTPTINYTGTPAGINMVGTASPADGAIYRFSKLPNVQLSSSPKTLNFGTVSAGASVDLCVTVRHAGTEGTLTFTPPAIVGLFASAYSVISSPTVPLTPGQTASYCIRFAPTQNGLQTAVLQIFSNGLDSGIQQILLTGDAVAPSIELAPIGDNFANRMFRKTRIRLGDTVEQGILIKNSGAGQLVISPSSNINGEYPQYYWITRLPDAAMTPGVTDTMFVKFSPREEGLLTANMTIISNASNGAQQVSLVGVGVIPRIIVTPDPMKFDSVQMGTIDTMKFTICNPGSDSLRILSNYMSSGDADFTLIPLSGSDLVIAPDKCREVTVIFKPLQMGTRVARFAITTNIPLTFDQPRRDTATKTLYYDITGTGVPVGTLVSSDIRTDGISDSTLIGVEKCREATITNIGDADVTINSTTFTGASAGIYSLKGITLPYLLKAKSSVTVQICATPTLAERGSNLVELKITGSSNEKLSSLTGTVDIKGLLACVTPTPTIAFQNVKVAHGMTDSADVTITNCGDVATAYTVSISGADATLYTVSPITSPVVAPSGTTTFRVYFTPISSGVKAGMLTFTGTAVSTTVDLAGEGACAVLDPISAVQAPATPAGSTQQFTVTVTNSGNLPWTPGTPVITPSTAFTYISATGTPIPGGGGQGTLTFSFNPPSFNDFTAVISFPDAGVCGNALEVNVAGSATTGSVKDVRTADGYILGQNNPNPALGGTTMFNYTVPANAKVRIVLADVTGKIVRELVNTSVSAGTYPVTIETTGLASGTYMYIMEAGNARLARQLSISK